MLLKYFLKRFFITFILCLLVLIPILSSCDVVARLASIPFSFQILKLFWFMLPLVALFALPIASCLTVGITVGSLFAKDELLLFRFFPGARKKLGLAVSLFSLFLLIIYIPLVFSWAPNGYWTGKRFLIHAVQQQIKNLSPQKFHQITSRAAIYFKSKNEVTEKEEKSVRFDEILLMIQEKDQKRYLVSANFGNLKDGVFSLFDGTIYNNRTKSSYLATFKTLEIDFDRMFFAKDKDVYTKSPKFLTLEELLQTKELKDSSWKEFHKRIVQIIWQLFFPFLIFWGIMILGKHKSNLLLSIILSGTIFLFSYISLNMAYFFLQRSYKFLAVFYSIPLVIVIIFYKIYRKRWT